MRKELQLGLFVFTGLVAFSISILVVKSIRLESGYRLHIYFNDVAGLFDKAWVRVKGVKVGNVEKISLDQEKAKVTVWLKGYVKVHRDATATIVATGLLGVKYIEISLGTDTESILKNGDTLEGIDPVSIDKIISKSMSGLNELTKVLTSFVGDGRLSDNLNELLQNSREIVTKLNQNLTDEKLKNFIDNASNAAGNINNFSKDISDIIDKEKENIKTALENIKSLSEKLDKLITKIESGETTIGKLLSDKEMGDDLKETVGYLKDASNEAKKTLARFTLFKAYWDYSLRYDIENQSFKSDIGLEIRPKQDKFYHVSVANAGSESGGTEKENTFNVYLGKDFSQFLTLYAGIIRSTGGLGTKIHPLYRWDPWNKLEIKTEIYDFARKIPQAKPKVILGTNYKFTKYSYVGVQSEDITLNNDLHAYMRLSFEDEDIAYLLGLIGLAQ